METDKIQYCPLCRSNSNVFSIKKRKDYDILYCTDCQLQFSGPMLYPGKAFYQKSSLYENRAENFPIKIGMPYYEWRYQTCLRFCVAKPNQSLLDIGCADGGFVDFAKSKGFNVFGIDIDERAIYIAKERRKLEHVENISWENLQNIKDWNDFDVITAFEILEHVSSPIDFVKTIFKLLKQGGLVCISVPRLDRYPRIFDIEADLPPHHLTLWTSKALNALLRNTGFKEISIIEKPLLIEDIIFHINLRTKRFIKRFRKGEINLGSKTSLHRLKRDSARSVNRGIVRFLKKLILAFLKAVNYFFAFFHIGRGHTLLAIAKKP